MDAKGVDTAGQAYYIDEWMPDYAFQYFLWYTNFRAQYSTITLFRDNFTKNSLANVTKIYVTEGSQSTSGSGLQYYMALMSMASMEGLQYATNLKEIYMVPNLSVSQTIFKDAFMNGNLWDIGALKFKQISSVIINFFVINDVTALGNKPNLTTLNLSYNQIADLSALQVT